MSLRDPRSAIRDPRSAIRDPRSAIRTAFLAADNLARVSGKYVNPSFDPAFLQILYDRFNKFI
jgi:hypothetical protein